jgi:hypothetical protein
MKKRQVIDIDELPRDVRAAVRSANGKPIHIVVPAKVEKKERFSDADVYRAFHFDELHQVRR